MPTLLVLRHGKSDWDADHAADVDRPLAPRGRRGAATMGRYLAAAGPLPDLAVTSPARRARDTLTLASEAMGWDGPVRVAASFYGRGPAAVLDELGRLGPDVDTVLVVGHEPTWSTLIGALTGARVRFPTAAMARLDADHASWAEIGPGAAELTWLVTPRTLGALRREP